MEKKLKSLLDKLDTNNFFKAYPEMSFRPSDSDYIAFQGKFRFTAKYKDLETLTDEYYLVIKIHPGYPEILPIVYEPNHRIKPKADYHVNSDESLCLGSTMHLWSKLDQDCSLAGFSNNCILPYLYGQSFYRIHQYYPFDELSHGLDGELNDIADLLNLDTQKQAKYALKLLGMKKNKANKKACPCGCNKTTGKCSFNHRLKKFRGNVSRKWYRALYSLHTNKKY